MQYVKKYISKRKTFLLAVLFLFVMIAVSLWDFGRFVEVQLEKEVKIYADDIREQSVFSLNRSIQYLADMLETEARVFQLYDSISDEEIIKELIEFAEGGDICRATIVTPGGTVYSSKFGKREIDPQPYRESFERPGIYINRPRLYAETGQQFIDISTVVYVGAQMLGSLSVSYDRSELEQIFKIAFSDNNCAVTVMGGDGSIIGRSSQNAAFDGLGNNIFDFYNKEDVTFLTGSSSEFQTAMSEMRPGGFQYEKGGVRYFVSYAPAGVNNWYVATTVIDSALKLQVHDLEKMVGLLVAKIVIVMILATLLFVAYYRDEHKRLEQLKNSYRLALGKSNDLFYEIDLETDTYVDRSEKREQSLSKTGREKYSEFIKRFSGFCPEEKRDSFLAFFSSEHLTKMLQEKTEMSCYAYQLRFAQKNYWFECAMIPVLENNQKAQRLIYVASDITARMLKTENLQNAARLDGLTLLYNKVAAKELIEDFLRQDGFNGKHALFMVDIDCFKEINDQFGHLVGDAAIVKFGRVLAEVFRKSDIVGRDGGDEFIAFLKDYTDLGLVVKKANEINALARRIRLADVGEDVKYQISVSIGIALFRENGSTFEELYKNADTALYLSKHAGKDGYTFFGRRNVEDI